MTTCSSFPSFRMDVPYYANFGYPKIIVMSAMVGLAVAMHQFVQPNQVNAPGNLSFGIDASLAACACLAFCLLVKRAFEQIKLSAFHVELVHAMPWNDDGRAALNGFAQKGCVLRLVHLRWIAQAHQRQVAAEGGDTHDLQATVFGCSLSSRYPFA